MQIRNVGVVSPGDMGQAIAGRLKESGLSVYAALDGRSERTRALARAAGLTDCGSMERLVATCELVLSVINPGEALNVALREVAAAMKKTARKIALADLNAVSPQTAREADRMVREAGGMFIDGGIIGPPPRGEKDKPASMSRDRMPISSSRSATQISWCGYCPSASATPRGSRCAMPR